MISNGSRPGGAFYAQADHELTDTIKLIGGFQANKIGDISLDAVPRGGLIWTPDLALERKSSLQPSLPRAQFE